MEWTISAVAKAAGTTTRTLRHYAEIGLLTPASTGSGGIRRYNEEGLLRLQRILLLRELGLGLEAIGQVLAGSTDEVAALHTHLELLEKQRARLDQLIVSVRTSVRLREEGGKLVVSELFDGFDHTRYKDEVEKRWGHEAYRKGDDWWRALSSVEKLQFQQEQHDIVVDFGSAYERGDAVDSERVQAITARLYHWLQPSVGGVSKDYFVGLGQLYVDSPELGANYGGVPGATFVRDAMRVYADREL